LVGGVKTACGRARGGVGWGMLVGGEVVGMVEVGEGLGVGVGW